MRNILVKFTRARLIPNFKVAQMPSLGRIDIAARCVLYGLWKSNNVREDTNVYLYCGKREKGDLIIFYGSKIRKLSPNEREIGIYISKAYTRYYQKNKKEIEYNGVEVREESWENIIRYLRNKSSQIFLLDRYGDALWEQKIRKGNILLILGDNKGLEEEDIAVINKLCKSKLYVVSIGREEYLTTQTISVFHWYLDNIDLISL